METGFENNAPIYLQLAQQIESDIISGKLRSGQRLPSVRDFALEFKVNPNTVQKALSQLEETGLIFTERTNGKFVTDNTALLERRRQESAVRLRAKYINDMKSIGFSANEALKLIGEWSDGDE